MVSHVCNSNTGKGRQDDDVYSLFHIVELEARLSDLSFCLMGDDGMAEWRKALATKPDEPSLISGTPRMERES